MPPDQKVVLFFIVSVVIGAVFAPWLTLIVWGGLFVWYAATTGKDV